MPVKRSESGRYLKQPKISKVKGKSVQVEMLSYKEMVVAQAAERSAHLVNRFCEEVALNAADRVSPGHGPGPHPHRTPHEDTGNARDAILTELIDNLPADYKITKRVGAMVWIDLSKAAYLIYLEMGWHTKAGTFYKYPWLIPAVSEVRATQLQKITREALYV